MSTRTRTRWQATMVGLDGRTTVPQWTYDNASSADIDKILCEQWDLFRLIVDTPDHGRSIRNRNAEPYFPWWDYLDGMPADTGCMFLDAIVEYLCLRDPHDGALVTTLEAMSQWGANVQNSDVAYWIALG